jgi:hypothetical protein
MHNVLASVLIAVAVGRLCEFVILLNTRQVDGNVDRALFAEEVEMGSDKVEPVAVRTIPEIVVTPPQD